MRAEDLMPPLDARGRRVPPGLYGPFILRTRLTRIARDLDELLTELLLVDTNHDMAYIPAKQIQGHFRDLAREIMDYVPAIPCDCAPGSACPLCGGKRWLNAMDIKRLLPQKQQSADSSVQSPAPEQSSTLKGDHSVELP